MTMDEITAAIQALHAEGKKPTMRAIRGKIGRGSYSDISRLLRSNCPRDTTNDGVNVPFLLSEVSRLTKRVAELEAAMARIGSWANCIYAQRRHLIGAPPPSNVPRSVEATIDQ